MQLLQAIGGAYNIYMIGRSLGQSVTQAFAAAISNRKLTVLEQSFLAGKVAGVLGTNALRLMTQEQLVSWIQTNNLSLSDAEQATLSQLRNDTERWVAGKTEEWQRKFRTAIANADRDWRATIQKGRFTDAAARSVARNAALEELLSNLGITNAGFNTQVDRLLQTEMHTYFQQGQISGMDGEEYVYKVPRLTACPHCMRLHLHLDGEPKKYKLADVAGNSNWGLPAYAWSFTIGPVHPHCYCLLFRTSDVNPGPNKERAAARNNVLKKATEHETKEETTTFEMLRKSGDGETPPPHQIKLLAAIREIYGDDPPR